MNHPIVDRPNVAPDDDDKKRRLLQAAKETILRESEDQVVKSSTVAIDEYWNDHRPVDEAALRRNLDADRWQMGKPLPGKD